ncbi:hypothetical protein Z949_1086 [Sulfitobacter guttiformis KCTC 32187]|nr:hypothetical protein Z949_1086 [Sulfitobacter guttiformis KCTC 32187]
MRSFQWQGSVKTTSGATTNEFEIVCQRLAALRIDMPRLGEAFAAMSRC